MENPKVSTNPENESSSNSTAIQYIEVNGMRFYKTTFMDVDCIRCENGYYNFTRMARENGYRDLERIMRNKEWKQFFEAVKQLYLIDTSRFRLILKTDFEKYEFKDELIGITEKNVYIEVNRRSISDPSINGRYYPKILLHHFASLISFDYCLKICHIVELLDEEIQLRSISTETWIKEQEEKVKSLETRLKNSNAGFNHEYAGAIIIHQTNTRNYKLIYKEVDIDADDYKNDIVVPTVYNIDKMRRLILFYVRNECIPHVHWAQANIFECEPITDEEEFKAGSERLIRLIRDIQGFSLELKFDVDKEIVKVLDKQYKNRNKLIGTLFELFCSKKYSIPLFKFNKTEIFSLSKNDTGVDLMNIDKSTIIQCKCYNSLLEYKRLQTFIDFCKRFNDWNRILMINSNTKIDANVVRAEQNQIFKIVIVDNDEFVEFCCSFGIDLEEKPMNDIEEEIEEIPIPNESQIDESKHSIEVFVNHLLDEKEEWLLSELLSRINQQFMLTLSQANFINDFKELYAQTRNGTILRDAEGHPIVRRNVGRESEIEWIINTIGFGEYFKEDFIQMHNEHFGSNYTSDSYIRTFGSMFEHDSNHKRAIFQRQISRQKRTLLRFQMDEEEYNAFKEFIDVRTTYTTFNERFHRYESSASFNKLKARLERPFGVEEPVENIELPESSLRIKSLSSLSTEQLQEITSFVRETIAQEPIKLIRMQALINERFHIYLEKHAFTHAFSSLYQKTRSKTIPRDKDGDYILISIE